jgi:general secretion pathway protein E
LLQVHPHQSLSSEKLQLSDVVASLLADKVIDKKTSDEILLHNRRKDDLEVHPLVIIANQNIKSLRAPHKKLTLEFLTEWYAGKLKVPYVKIDPLKVDVTAVTAVMSFAFAERNKILAISTNSNEVVIATAQPLVNDWESGLQQKLHKNIKRVFANPLDINRYIVEFYSLSHSVKRASGQTDDTVRFDTGNLEQLIELGKIDKPDVNDQHVVNIVDWLLQYAFDQRASDIHIEPRREAGKIRFRIDGMLQNVYEMPVPVMNAMISRVKSLGRMDLAEKRRPLDGRLKTRSPDGKEIELRLSTMPTAFGEKLVMRIFDPNILMKGFDKLGLTQDDYLKWKDMVQQTSGIVLVTGPTGSGKTTTLYSTLKQLAKPHVNVCTIEDPIELVEPEFNQMQVQSNIDLDFASGVRALLRQDPDIIMIGEIRDRETAEIAIQAALTGHLVISTMHTNDAASAITRLIEIGVPPYLINATLIGVMAQRLVRILCPHCKKEGSIDENTWQALTYPWKAPTPQIAYLPTGCLECRNTGFLGREGIYEVLSMSSVLRKVVKSNCDAGTVRSQAIRDGMRLLRLSGAQKLAGGITTVEEILRVCPAFDDE